MRCIQAPPHLKEHDGERAPGNDAEKEVMHREAPIDRRGKGEVMHRRSALGRGLRGP